jgi:hypothetical protein
MAESDNILTKLQDLLVYVILQITKFLRDQRFVLGDRIKHKLLNVQESCLRAYYGGDKRGHLLEANLRLEVARHLVLLAHALCLFSRHTYGVLAGKMDEVGVRHERSAEFDSAWPLSLTRLGPAKAGTTLT